MYEIRHRLSGEILFRSDAAETVKAALEEGVQSGAYLTGAHLAGAHLAGAYLAGAYLAGAYLAGANLAGAYLTGANLAGAHLAGAHLAGAYLTGANLTGANLTGANLTGANLAGAYLTGAYLTGAKVAWQSHWMIAELLRRAAGKDVDKRMLAGLIAISTDWCWKRFLTLDRPLRDWALDVLAAAVQDGDGAPEVLRRRRPAPGIIAPLNATDSPG